MDEQGKKPKWRDEPRNWFIIITNPQCEAKAAGELRRAGIRVYVPKRTVERKNRRTGEITAKHRPAWTGYLVVRFPENMCERGVPKFGIARNCQGVKDFVKWPAEDGYDRPIPFPDRLVLAYMRRQKTGDYDGAKAARSERQIRQSRFRPGVTVRITEGPFAMFLARLERTRGEVAHLVTEVFGRETPLQVDKYADTLEIVADHCEAA